MKASVGVDPGTLAGALVGIRALADAERLLVLDDLWTSALEGMDPDDPIAIERQQEAFGHLVAALDETPSGFPIHLKELEGVLNSVSDEAVEEALNEVLEGDATQSLAMVFGDEITEVGPRGAGIFACQFLLEETAQERSILAAKYERLAVGELPDPDLRPIYRCALYLAKLGAAAVAVIGSHGLVLAMHIGKAVGTGIRGWKKARCVDAWAEITGGRV